MPAPECTAQAAPPRPAYGYGEQMRVRGLTETPAGLPTAALADEILLPGPGQVRALISCGGNPVAAWPDQHKVIEAMKALDVLVQIDPWMSADRRVRRLRDRAEDEPGDAGHHPDARLPRVNGVGYGLSDAYADYSPAIVEPPPGSELVEEWEFFYGLARRMGLELTVAAQIFYALDPVQLDMEVQPTTDELLELICTGSRVPLATVKAAAEGRWYSEPAVVVAEKAPGWEGRLDVANADMLRDLRASTPSTGAPRPSTTMTRSRCAWCAGA